MLTYSLTLSPPPITDRALYSPILHFHPCFVALTANAQTAAATPTVPAKTCKPTHPLADIAPAIGSPINRPIDRGMRSIPKRIPTTPMLRQSVTAIVGEIVVVQ